MVYEFCKRRLLGRSESVLGQQKAGRTPSLSRPALFAFWVFGSFSWATEYSPLGRRSHNPLAMFPPGQQFQLTEESSKKKGASDRHEHSSPISLDRRCDALVL